MRVKMAVNQIGVKGSYKRFLLVKTSFISFILLLSFNSFASLKAESYGLLPTIRSMSISPDGKHVAYIQRVENKNYFVIYNIEKSKVVGGADAGKMKPRSIYFATNNKVILVASKTQSKLYFRGKWEHSWAVVYDINKKKMKPLLNATEGLYPAQTGLGNIIGLNIAKNEVYMPAFTGQAKNPSYDLYKVRLKSGRGKIHARGKRHTIQWFVDNNGRVLAREDYDEDKQRHQILSKVSGKWQTIYYLDTNLPDIAIKAVNTATTKLLFTYITDDRSKIYAMDLADGTIEGPLYEDEDRDIESILTKNLDNKMVGIQYSGLIPAYEFVLPELNNVYRSIAHTFPDNTINIVSVAEDLHKLIVKVSGNDGTGDYYFYDASKKQLQFLEAGYPDIDEGSIAEIKAYQIKARDNQKIPTIITWPVGVKERKKLPLLVFPHGGPASYDFVHFDWWAQYFARKGYMIVQPNFRGSSGFGLKFKNAGKENWGKLMQDDVTDVVKNLVDAEFVDPNRICIMGASYGGYSALAGGAFTPELYRCVISVNGVSDLPAMISTLRRLRGKKHLSLNYWRDHMGEDKEQLNLVSPANFAEQFKAPVLLIHAKDDTRVHYKQSKIMYKALTEASKKVKLIPLKGEDHWLSKSETRLEMLKSIDSFLELYNPL